MSSVTFEIRCSLVEVHVLNIAAPDKSRSSPVSVELERWLSSVEDFEISCDT